MVLVVTPVSGALQDENRWKYVFGQDDMVSDDDPPLRKGPDGENPFSSIPLRRRRGEGLRRPESSFRKAGHASPRPVRTVGAFLTEKGRKPSPFSEGIYGVFYIFEFVKLTITMCLKHGYVTKPC